MIEHWDRFRRNKKTESRKSKRSKKKMEKNICLYIYEFCKLFQTYYIQGVSNKTAFSGFGKQPVGVWKK